MLRGFGVLGFWGSSRSHDGSLCVEDISFLESEPFHFVLVLELLLDVLVAQKHLLEVQGALLLLLVLASLNFLLESKQFVLLLLDLLVLEQLALVVAVGVVLVAFLLLHLVAADLHAVGLGVVLLLGQVQLDFAHVQQLGRGLEDVGERLVKLRGVVVKLADVALLHGLEEPVAVLLELVHALVPLLVELVELHDVGLLQLQLVVLLADVELIELLLLLVLLELGDAVLSHLCLHVLATHFALSLVLLKDLDEFVDVPLLLLVVLVISILVDWHFVRVLIVVSMIVVLICAGTIHVSNVNKFNYIVLIIERLILKIAN